MLHQSDSQAFLTPGNQVLLETTATRVTLEEDASMSSDDDRSQKQKGPRTVVEDWVVFLVGLTALVAVLHASVEYSSW